MSSNESLIFAALTLGAPAFLLVMLLPALIELRKPRDLGPRLILSSAMEMEMALGLRNYHILDIEDKYELNFSAIPLLKVILDRMPTMEV